MQTRCSSSAGCFPLIFECMAVSSFSCHEPCCGSWYRSAGTADTAVVGGGHRCHAHPNIVQLREVFLTQHHLAIVLEYMKGSNMPTYLAKHAPLPEPVARCAAPQLPDSFVNTWHISSPDGGLEA